MPTLRLLTTSCQFICLVICVSIAIFFAVQAPKGIQIDTDLKSMSPQISKNTGVQTAISTLSSSIEKRFTLALYASDLDELEEAFDLFIELAEQHNAHFTLIDSLDTLDTYTQTLAQHRFHILTEKQYQQLQGLNKTHLWDQAERRLYNTGSAFQLFSFSQDPFGFLSDFVLESGGNTSAQDDEFIEVTNNGKTQYFVTASFSIQGNALKLDKQQHIQSTINSLEKNTNAQFPTVKFLHSGIIFFATDAAQKSKADISLISTGSTIGILILLMGVFRSFKALIFPAVSIAVGIGFAFTICHLLFQSVHIITIVFGAGLIGVVIDYALHYIYHQKHNLRDNPSRNKDNDSPGTETQLHKALAFSLVTSLIGYGALALSDLESLRRVALFSGLGLIGAWFTVVALGPYVIANTVQTRDAFLASTLKYGSALIGKLNNTIIALIVIASILGSVWVGYKGINVSDSPRVFFSINQELLKQEQQVSALTSSYEPGTYLVVRGKTTQQIYNEIAKLPLNTISPSGIFPLGIHRLLSSPKQQENNYIAQAALYQGDALALEYLRHKGINTETLTSLEQEYTSAKENILTPSTLLTALGKNTPPLWVEVDQLFYSFILIPRDFTTGALEKIAEQEPHIFFINTAKMAETTIKEQRESALMLILLALVLVAVIVMLRYQQVAKLQLVLVPASAIFLTLLFLQIVGVPLTLFHAMALFLVLGLGMDYVIFVSELPEHSSETLHAVILSAITSLLSFGLLSISSLPIVSAFGMTVLIGNSLNLLGTIFLAKRQAKAY